MNVGRCELCGGERGCHKVECPTRHVTPSQELAAVLGTITDEDLATYGGSDDDDDDDDDD